MRMLVLTTVLSLALSGVSCVESRPLASPAPPAPTPAESPSVSRRAESPPPPQRVERPPPPMPKPSFSVTMVEKSGEGRAPAAEQAVKAVNLLVQNDYQAHVAKPPEVLPASRIEAAQKAAQAEGPQKGDIFLFGEISSGPMVQVRLTAIDPRDGKIIDDRGFESTTKPADEIVRKTLEEMLPAVEAYWKSRKN